MQEINNALKNVVDYLDSNPLHRIYPNTPLHIEAKKALGNIGDDWSQQDLTFKVAELLEHGFDIKYAKTDILINAYQIESSLNSIIESLGLELTIIDRAKFECTLVNPFDI